MGFQYSSSLYIRCFSLWVIVLRTINFNNQSGRCTVKINYVTVNDSLLVNFHGIFLQK